MQASVQVLAVAWAWVLQGISSAVIMVVTVALLLPDAKHRGAELGPLQAKRSGGGSAEKKRKARKAAKEKARKAKHAQSQAGVFAALG